MQSNGPILHSQNQSNSGVPGEPFQIQSAEFMLAEYELLRNLRQDLIAHAETRVNFFLATVTGAIVALGLLNDAISKELAYLVGSFIYVGLLSFGWLIYTHMVQRNNGAALYARAVNLVRRYFAQNDPILKAYLSLPLSDAVPAIRTSGTGGTFGLPQLIAIINSFLLGSASSIILAEFLTPHADWFFWIVLAGAAVTLAAFLAHRIYDHFALRATNEAFRTRFPVQNDADRGTF